jgi:hypothetical protein
MLRAADLDLDRLEPTETWQVFKAFAAEPVEGVGPNPDDDMCLFQYGVYDWSDGKGRRFNWNLTRQFTIYEDGEYDHMEHLRCDLYFEPVAELEPLQGDGTWSGRDLDEWAAEVEAQEGFRAVTPLTPVESSVEQEHV